MHALCQPLPLPETIPQKIPENIIHAAVHLVQQCIIHTALIAGREVQNGKILQEQLLPGPAAVIAQPTDEERKLQQLVITQAGPIISATRLTNISKVRSNGGKQKVLLILTALANKHLATISHRRGNVSTLLSVIPLYSCNSLLCQVCYDYQQSK